MARWFALLVALIALGSAGVAHAAKQNQDKTCGNTRISIGFADTLYSALNNNGEGKIGPRRLVVSQSGSIVSKGTRLFVAQTPMDISQATVKIVKTDGRGKTSVAICATDSKDKQTILKQFDIPNGTSNIGTTYTRSLTKLRDKRVSVYFKGRSVTNSMSYRMYYERPNAGDIFEPSVQQLATAYAPIPGFADLHAHQAANWAYARGWYFGPMDKPLPPDPRSHSKRLTVKLAGIPLKELRPDHAGKALPSWDDSSHQAINIDQLLAAHKHGLGLMVAPAVNSEWLCSILAYPKQTNKRYPCNDMESAKLQILKMKRLDEEEELYKIVTDPWQARDAAYKGQLPVVLAIEASDLFPSSDGDWRRQLDEFYDMGVRVVYIAHETNNRFAGAAYHHTEDLKLPNELTALFSRDIKFASKPGGTRNAVGLTPLGRELVRELMRHHMLIDVDHVSWKGVDDIAAITRAESFYPLYAGHTRIFELLTPELLDLIPELNTPQKVFDFIKESGGMIGMRTGPDGILTYGQSGVLNNCHGSVRSLLQTYQWIVHRGVPAAFGTDLNGFVETTGPRFGPDACPDATNVDRPSQRANQTMPSLAGAPPSWSRYARRGLSDIGTEPAVVFDMKALGADTTNLENSAQSFIKMWVRTYDPQRVRIQ